MSFGREIRGDYPRTLGSTATGDGKGRVSKLERRWLTSLAAGLRRLSIP